MILFHNKKGNIKILKIDDLKPKNEAENFYQKSKTMMSNICKKLIK